MLDTIQKNGDPYISLTEDLSTAATKYAYGMSKSESGKYKLNDPKGKKRGVVLLVDLNEDVALTPDIYEKPPEGKISYYTYQMMSETPEFKNTKALGYAKADKEAEVFHEVPAEHVYEIHPFLVDILMAADYYKNRGRENAEYIYEEIKTGIKTGKYSVANIEKMLEQMKTNPIEKEFVEKFYSQRENIEETFDKLFPEKAGEYTTEEKIYYATCLRTQVTKDLFKQFVEREFKGIDPKFVEDYVFPMEEDLASHEAFVNTTMYRHNGNRCIDKISTTNSKRIPFGMEYTIDDTGKIVGMHALHKVIERTKYYYGPNKNEAFYDPKMVDEIRRSTLIEPEKEENSHYYGTDLVNNEQARMQREVFINKRENQKNVRITLGEKGFEFYSFDEDGYCLKCELEIREKEQYLKVVDFLRDENGQRTKFDTKGLDRDGFDKDGFDENGLDRNGCDRSGATEFGIPKGLSVEEIKRMTVEGCEGLFRECEENYKRHQDRGIKFEKSPTERFLDMVVKSTLNSTGFIIHDDGKVEIDNNKGRSEDRFYDLMMKNIKHDQKTLAFSGRKGIDNLIKAAIAVGKENGIDIHEMFSTQMQQEEIEDKAKLEEAEKALKKARKKSDRQKEKINKGKHELGPEKRKIDKDRFDEKYDDGR